MLSWPTWSIILEFAWRNWGKQWKTWIKILGVLNKIKAETRSSTVLMLHQHPQPHQWTPTLNLVLAFVACSYFIYIKLNSVITEPLWHKTLKIHWSNHDIFTRHQATETIQQTRNLYFHSYLVKGMSTGQCKINSIFSVEIWLLTTYKKWDDGFSHWHWKCFHKTSCCLAQWMSSFCLQ
jgi:hypothetical protein